MNVSIRLIKAEDTKILPAAFADSVWEVTESHFERFLAEQDAGERTVLLAYSDEVFSGYVTIKWKSDYPDFAEKAIPEINDLRVLLQFRRQGIASALLDEAEKRIFEQSGAAGIGVGMYADYGPAQRMYILRGYVPDGAGLFYNNKPVIPGQDVSVDDDLLLYLTKER